MCDFSEDGTDYDVADDDDDISTQENDGLKKVIDAEHL